MISVQEALAGAARRLAESGVADAGREASWLLAHVLDCNAGALRGRGAEPLAPAEASLFAQYVARRANREPIQYILGSEEFLGLQFQVTPAVLIPRFDTEVLVRLAAERLVGRSATAADIGTGSGAIAVGLASLLPQVSLVAVDISAAALEVAAANARRNGVADRVEFRHGDLLAPVAGERLDAILSNPPYIDEAEWRTLMPEVLHHEPKLALTPGPDGLAIYRRLAAEAPGVLKQGGFLAAEVGAGQAGDVAALFAEAGFTNVTMVADTAGIERVVLGEWSRENG